MARDEARFLHKPSSALVGGFEEQRGFVEEVERHSRPAGLFPEALQDEESAMLCGEDVERLKRVGGRAFREDESVGLEREAGHESRGRRGEGKTMTRTIYGAGDSEWGQGGTTAPPEMIIFMPSPTLISSSMTSLGGNMRR